MATLLYSVREVFSGEKGFLPYSGKSHYNIPEYQRGYKWTKNEVEVLLGDIWDYDAEGDDFYCLQNITLVNHKDGYFNVVDGQQRLSTLYIILSYLGEKELVRDRLTYPIDSIRSKTFEFLNEFILKDNEVDVYSISWEEFNEKTDSLYNYQDVFYLCSTANTVKYWIEKKEEIDKTFNQDKLRGKLLNKVKLIVNNLEETDEEKVFGNVNSKRIPLDGSDLIRAILITRVAKEEFGKTDDDPRLNIRVNERRVRIGLELDEINNWWSKDEVKNYFKPFISIQTQGDVKFSKANYPINYLYALYAEKENAEVLSLKFIEEKNNATKLYEDIKKLNTILKDWYNDNLIYHYLGYLFSQKTNTSKYFSYIFRLWEKVCDTREEFIAELKNEIKKDLLDQYRDNINNVDGELSILEFNSLMPIKSFDIDGNDNSQIDAKDWYSDSSNQRELIKILLLLDIIHVTIRKEKFIRLPTKAFTRTGKDIEHIFPQQPQQPKKDKEAKEQKDFIEFLNKYTVKDDYARFDLRNYMTRYNDETYSREIKEFINKLTEGLDINSIGNLVLLDESINRSVKNAPYSEKRLVLIKKSNKGRFIHPHTFNVFVRYFTDDKESESLDLEYWTKKDIEINFTAIRNKISSFFDINLTNK